MVLGIEVALRRYGGVKVKWKLCVASLFIGSQLNMLAVYATTVLCDSFGCQANVFAVFKSAVVMPYA